MTVIVTHPHIGLLADPDTGVARVWNDVLAGRWGIAADVCSSRLTDPVTTRRVLDDIGADFAVPDAARLAATLDGDTLTFDADLATVTSAVDLFMRILCGQWNEMRFYCTLRGGAETPVADIDLTVLRAGASREYDETVPWVDRAFPPHPNASVSIAQATLPARLAYHVYKALGAGAPGTPTFALPDGPVAVEVQRLPAQQAPPPVPQPDSEETTNPLVGLVAAAMSSPTLPPTQAIFPWGEQAARVVAEVIEPLVDEIWRAVHVQRFAASDGTLRGPDTFYNGTRNAAQTVKQAAAAWMEAQHAEARAAYEKRWAEQ